MAEVLNLISRALSGTRNDAFAEVQSARQTDLNVETIRGLACILLVAFHVVGGKPYTGLRIEDPDSLYRLLTDALAYVRMPLFTFLSGYVYAMRPFRKDSLTFIRGKVRRLLVPMLVVGTLFAVIKTLTPGTNTPLAPEDFLTLHIIPVEHFWFIEALFWVFMLVMLLEMAGLLSNGYRFTVVLAAAAALHLLWQEPPIWFALSGAVYLLPFFLFGAACKQFREFIFQPHVLWPAGVLLAGCTALVVMGIFGLTERAPDRSVLALIVGGGSGLFLLASQWRQRGLIMIGAYAYSIYLYHVFAAAPSRIILERLGVTDHSLLLVAGLVAGILGSIVIDLIASRYGWSRLLLLGKKRNCGTTIDNLKSG